MSSKGHDNLAAGLSQRDYYALMRSRLPEKHQTAAEVINRVNKEYVNSKRDEILAESFNKFVVWITSEQRNQHAGKGDAFYITGESGAGKTDIVRNLLTTHPVLKPLDLPIGKIEPCISVSLPGPATLRVLALMILKKAGYPMHSKKREASLWAELPEALQNAGILFVHIDEFQHLFHPGYDVAGLVKYIKGLMNNDAWPVSFIISGMPSVRNIILNDDQAERRNNSFLLPALDMPKNKIMVRTIVERLCGAGDLTSKSLVESDMLDRIAHAANYQFGRICEVTVTAIQEAALAGDDELTRKHFALAYVEHSDTRGRDNLNPFMSSDWRSLKAGYFILKPKKKEEVYDEYSES